MIHTTTHIAKFKLLARRLRNAVGTSPVSVETITVGLLERLWHLAATSAPRGDVGRHDDELIAEVLGWNLSPSILITALVESGWLDVDSEHRLVVHDWHEHAPNFIKGNVLKLGGFVSKQAPPQGPPPRDPPQGPPPRDGPQTGGPSNLIKPNQTKPEEKDSPEPPKPAASVPTVQEPALLVFPTVGKDGREWRLTQSQVDRWRELFPDLDILAQCRNALAWVEAKPSRKKTVGGMQAFLVGWFGRTTDRAPPEQRTPAQPNSNFKPFKTKQDAKVEYMADQINRVAANVAAAASAKPGPRIGHIVETEPLPFRQGELP